MSVRAAIWALATGQALAYACFYYVFAALVLPMHEETGWSKTLLASGPTLAILIAGILAPVMGRLVDRGGSIALLTGGPILGAGALAALSVAPGPPAYLMAWAVMGLAQAASLYEVCFAFLIRRLGEAARAAIARVTLVAGFASTLAFPTGALLSDSIGWRGAVLAASAVALIVIAPLQGLAARTIRRGGPVLDSAARERDKRALSAALKRPVFWLLGTVLGAIALNHWMIIAFFVPAFVALGATEALAVLAAALVGPAQVAGRLLLLRYEDRLANGEVLAICLGGMGLAVLVLLLAGLSPQLALLYALLQGAAIGVMTILRPVLIAQVLGPHGYGAIAGTLQVMPLLAGAAAPVVGAIVLGGLGPLGLGALSGGLVLAASLGALRLRRMA